MQAPNLKILLLAISLGAVASAGAQTYTPAPDSSAQPVLNPPSPAPAAPVTDIAPAAPGADTTVIMLAPTAPANPDGTPSGLDSRADSKCRNIGVNEYWNCVNSYNGQQ